MKSISGSVLALLLVLVASATLGQAPTRSTDPDFAVLLEGVRERIHKYYVDLQRIAWTAKVRQDTLKADGTPKERARELVYETIIRLQQPDPGDTSLPFYIRDISDLKLNDNKPAKSGDRPQPLMLPQPGGWLLFVLSKDWRAPNYRFSDAGQVVWEGRRTYLIDVGFPSLSFAPEPIKLPGRVSPSSGPAPRVAWQGDRFLFYGLEMSGRLWIDAESLDVRQLETRTTPFEFFKPNGRDKLVFDTRTVYRFRPLGFENPNETFLVPESIETAHTTKGAGASTPVRRIVHSYGNYKRFSGDIQITPLPTP